MSCSHVQLLHLKYITGVESIFIARFDKINDLFPLQMSRSQSCCFPFVYLKHISLRVSGISMLSFSTEKSISSRLSNRLVRTWQWLIYKYIVFMWLNWNQFVAGDLFQRISRVARRSAIIQCKCPRHVYLAVPSLKPGSPGLNRSNWAEPVLSCWLFTELSHCHGASVTAIVTL